MKEISLEEQRVIQIQLLKQISDFCDRNSLKYFLAYGTLIGAIRHKGFIPWDDDIDIAMPRDDYDQFVKTYNNAYQFSKVVDMDTNESYGFAFAKVHDIRTIVYESQYAQDCFGVFVDVFPIDGIKDESQIYKSLRLRKLLHTKKANYSQRKFSKKVINFLGKIVLLPFSVHYILRFIDKNARKHPFGTTPKCACIVEPFGTKEIVDTSIFVSAIDHEFEGNLYKIPIGYDKWLRNIYGDYMQLPPIEKRITHHVFKAWWKDNI
jgi:lipopolysaccharide cholinephosphotransferase